MNDIKQALEALAVDGLLKPSSVVDAARNPDSPLHGHFCWDDTEAAEKWREEQARQLIRNIRIIVDLNEPVEVRAYVSLPADREAGNGYRKMMDVVSSDFMRRQLAEEIGNKIEQWEQQAKILGAIIDFSSVKKAAGKVVKRLAA